MIQSDTERNLRRYDEPYNGRDEFLCEASDQDADEVGKLMCRAYKYASDFVFEWYKENPDMFPNHGAPEFAFNLDGGFKVGDNYLSTH